MPRRRWLSSTSQRRVSSPQRRRITPRFVGRRNERPGSALCWLIAPRESLPRASIALARAAQLKTPAGDGRPYSSCSPAVQEGSGASASRLPAERDRICFPAWSGAVSGDTMSIGLRVRRCGYKVSNSANCRGSRTSGELPWSESVDGVPEFRGFEHYLETLTRGVRTRGALRRDGLCPRVDNFQEFHRPSRRQ